MLSAENHDVVVIEHNEDRVEIIREQLDVKVLHGNGASWVTLEAAGLKTADMVVAVTEEDELNMIACHMAKKFGVKTTVARVRNPQYVESAPHYSPEEMFGIDLIINPERVTAKEIFKIVKNPEANNIDFFADGRVELIELPIDKTSKLAGKKIKTLDTSLYVIVAILRERRTIVPGGEDELLPGDRVYIMANANNISSILELIGIKRKKAQQITILGAGRTGYYLVNMIEESKLPVRVKLIEKNPKRAREVSGKLKNALIIQGDGSDLELLQAENIGQSDLFVAVTDDDKLNLLSSLIAKNLGVTKTVCKIKRSDIVPLIEQVGIDVVLSPRVLSAGAILRYIRKGSILSVTVLGEERAEMIELIAQPGSIAVGKQLKNIDFPNGSIIGAIVRNDQVIVPEGLSEIKTYDRLMVFTISKSIRIIEKLFASEGQR
jgi:trk system potassium uptake protein TrkA